MSGAAGTPLAAAQSIVAPLVRQDLFMAEKVSALPSPLASAAGEVAALPRQLTARNNVPTITGNTPAMPLPEAHFGGFFLPGGCA